MTLTLLWQEYRTAHPEGHGYRFCERFAAYQHLANPTFRHRPAPDAVMQIDYAGRTVEVIDPHDPIAEALSLTDLVCLRRPPRAKPPIVAV
ncbi:hypothetical protein [Bradyrhizobium sp. ORS 111]|uniref:hypothetical protein n=1 Tax=Bradyrhizobium sp. ORS 111 TaxID=1685958 RepID=UPI0038910A8B